MPGVRAANDDELDRDHVLGLLPGSVRREPPGRQPGAALRVTGDGHPGQVPGRHTGPPPGRRHHPTGARCRDPTDRGKQGWKWSVAVDRHGIPIGWTIDGANRNDVRMLEPTLDDIAAAGLLVDIDTMHLDRGYDSGAVRERLAGYGLTDVNIQRRGTKEPGKKQPVRLGLRWIVEATNTWWSNYGQLRRNTDRRNVHRHAALCLATVILIVGKLIAWRDRWDPK